MSDRRRQAVEALFNGLAHDLHFRAASFVPDLRHRPKSLSGALPSEEDALERWGSMAFDDIEREVQHRVGDELDRQFPNGDEDYADWRARFLEVFPKVEYLVNARLLHALTLIPGRALHEVVCRLMREHLPGEKLCVPRDAPKVTTEHWRRDYHTVQNDGVLVGDRALVLLELKAVGKTKGTKFGAGQLAKLAWQAERMQAGSEIEARRLLVVLPRPGRWYLGTSGDVQADVVMGRISLTTKRLKPFTTFLAEVGWSVDDAERAIAGMDPRVCSYADIARTCGEVLPSLMGDDALELLQQLEGLVENANVG